MLLSLSTTYMQQEDLLQRLVDALGQVDCHALVTTGPGLRSRPLARVPSNVHVVESVPHGAVLPHVDLVITHGGHGTVIRALAGGVPVMVVPISRDQPDNAARVRAPPGRGQGLEAIVTGEVRRGGAACPRRRRAPRRTPATWPSGWRPTWVRRRPSPPWRTCDRPPVSADQPAQPMTVISSPPGAYPASSRTSVTALNEWTPPRGTWKKSPAPTSASSRSGSSTDAVPART